MQDVEEVRGAVVDALAAAGHGAEHWHSGGGIFGIQITLGSGATLFTTLEADGDTPYQWTWLDWNAHDDDDSALIANVNMQVRPLGTPDEGTPEQFAEALLLLLKYLK